MVEQKRGNLSRVDNILTNDQKQVLEAILHGFTTEIRISKQTGIKISKVHDVKRFLLQHVGDGIGTVRLAKVVTLAVLNDEIDTDFLEKEPQRPFTKREYKMLTLMALGLNEGQLQEKLWTSNLGIEKKQVLQNLNTNREIIAVAWMARKIRSEFGNIPLNFNRI